MCPCKPDSMHASPYHVQPESHLLGGTWHVSALASHTHTPLGVMRCLKIHGPNQDQPLVRYTDDSRSGGGRWVRGVVRGGTIVGSVAEREQAAIKASGCEDEQGSKQARPTVASRGCSSRSRGQRGPGLERTVWDRCADSPYLRSCPAVEGAK